MFPLEILTVIGTSHLGQYIIKEYDIKVMVSG